MPIPASAKSMETAGNCHNSSGFGEEFLNPRDVFWSVNAHGIVLRLHNSDAVAIFQPAQLLELFNSLEVPLRKCRELQ
jgi:hypothetical protein